jgi:beta-phosphoglucomutase
VKKAVLFDFDGTLARTMEDNFLAWQAVMAAHGVHLQPQDYYPLEGLRVEELARRFSSMHGDGAAPDAGALVRQKDDYYLVHHQFALYPGVEEEVARLRAARVPMGLVTTGLRPRLQKSVPASFLAQFDAVVTGEDTEEGKPSPAPYLAGAWRLGVEPEACLIVENAPLGITAAKRAGSYCIALCTTLDRAFLMEADEIFASFQELEDAGRLAELLGVAAARGAP